MKKSYKLWSSAREIKNLRRMSEDDVFHVFMSDNYSDNLILETDSYDAAKACLAREMPVMRIGRPLNNGAVPVDCCWIEEFEDGEYAGTLDHSAFPAE